MRSRGYSTHASAATRHGGGCTLALCQSHPRMTSIRTTPESWPLVPTSPSRSTRGSPGSTTAPRLNLAQWARVNGIDPSYELPDMSIGKPAIPHRPKHPNPLLREPLNKKCRDCVMMPESPTRSSVFATGGFGPDGPTAVC